MSIITLSALITATVLYFGQGCGALGTVDPASVNKPANNGGSYGGMAPKEGGPYDVDGRAEFDEIKKFYLFKDQTRCLTGPFIDGVVTVNPTTFDTYQRDRCTPPQTIPDTVATPAIGTTDFNSDIITYANQIYIYKATVPANPNLVEFAQAYCKKTELRNGIEQGTDIFVYSLGGVMKAAVKQGAVVNGASHGLITVFDPVTVTVTRDTQLRTVESEGIHLRFENVTTRRAIGHLTLLIKDQAPLIIDVNCVLTD